MAAQLHAKDELVQYNMVMLEYKKAEATTEEEHVVR
jgi:hypothetical protein